MDAVPVANFRSVSRGVPTGPLRVAVATPTRGLVQSLTIESVTRAVAKAVASGAVRTTEPWWTFGHGQPIPQSHEAAVQAALATGADAVLLVEDDNIVPEGGLLEAAKLMQTSGAGLVAVDYPVGVVGTKWDSIYRQDGEVVFCGLGITLVHRSVFEALERPWFRLDQRMGIVRREGKRTLGLVKGSYRDTEGGVDVVFSLRAREAGFKIAEVPGLVGGHIRVRKLGPPQRNDSPHRIEVWDTIDREQLVFDGLSEQSRFEPPEVMRYIRHPSPATLASAFHRLGPWITRFEKDGQHYGGKYDAAADVRLEQCRQSFPAPKRVVEFGALEGGHTVPLSKWAQEVVAVEGREANLSRLSFILRVYDRTNVDPVLANLENHPLEEFAPADLCFCVGLLYHLPNPMRFLRTLPKVAPNLFLWTHHAGRKAAKHREFGLKDPLSGLSRESLWLSKAELLAALGKLYGKVKVLAEEEDHHGAGPAITLVARS